MKNCSFLFLRIVPYNTIIESISDLSLALSENFEGLDKLQSSEIFCCLVFTSYVCEMDQVDLLD